MDSLDNRLPDLEQQRAQLEGQIAAKRDELDDEEAVIEDADSTVDDTREQKSEFENALDDRQEIRSDLDNVRYRLDSERESIQALADERDEISTELEELSETPAGDISDTDAEIDRLREHKQSLESTINQLQCVLQFNEEMREGNNPELQQACRTLPTAKTREHSLTNCLPRKTRPLSVGPTGVKLTPRRSTRRLIASARFVKRNPTNATISVANLMS